VKLGATKIDTEIFKIPNANTIAVAKYHFIFPEWQTENTFDNYNGKSILNCDGEPVFAELFILRLLERQGFEGVWVDTYRNKFWKKFPSLSEPVSLDTKLHDVYKKIYSFKSGRKSGCFDVMAYKDNQFIFVELKRSKKDSIRHSQIEWLEAALKAGFNINCFIIAEWELKNIKK
jgi:hypothetical protein